MGSPFQQAAAMVRLATVFLLAVSASAQSATPSCSEGWSQNDMTCYKLFNKTRVTWKTAQYKCAKISQNAKLAVAKSETVNNFIGQLGHEEGWHFNKHGLWLGGRQAPGSEEPAGGWTWVNPIGTGTLISEEGYTNWGLSDPENRSKDPKRAMVTTGADCLIMVGGHDVRISTSFWWDRACNSEEHYMCEEPARVRGEPCQKCGMAERKPMSPKLVRSSPDRIMNGTETEVHEYPWMVRLAKPDPRHDVFCGGTLLNGLWVLTAETCKASVGDIAVLGDHNFLGTEANEFKEKHHKIAEVMTQNKLALLRLERPTDFGHPFVLPACFPSHPETNYGEGMPAIATGWGTTNQAWISPKLQELKMTVIDNSHCNTLISDSVDPIMELLASDMFCAKNENGNTAGVDMGGPLVVESGHRYELVGVTTGEFSRPASMFVKVSSYIDWIKEEMAAYDNVCP